MVTARSILLVVGISILLTLIAFRGMDDREFLFVHDEFLVLSLWDAKDAFYLHDDDNFGSYNATALIVNFFDRAYYLTVLSLGFDFGLAQRGLYFFKVVMLFVLPLLGFFRLGKLFIAEKLNRFWIFGVSLWYACNTYTLIYWNNNAFPLTLIICYSLAPLALYFLHQVIFIEDRPLSNYLLTAIILFLMSFALPLFLAFGIFYFVYGGLFFLLHIQSRRHHRVNFVMIVLKNSTRLILVSLPLFLCYGFIAYGMVAESAPTMNLAGGETYGSLRGGVLYQFLHWFSWGIYVPWKPKSIFSFADYFTQWYSLAAPFCLYVIVAAGQFMKNMRNKVFLATFGSWLAMHILVKGGQSPFGAVYLFLLDQVSLFRAFRSPDTKFGFVIILALGLLLLFSYSKSWRYTATLILGGVVFIQAALFFSGTAIRGENSKNSFDRIISIPSAHQELAQFLNQPSRYYGSVVLFPQDEFGLFQLESGDRFIGQDLLPKLINLPFVRVSEYGSLPAEVFSDLKRDLLVPDMLRKYPIRYYIIRNDIGSIPASLFVNTEYFQRIFENSVFQVYENYLAPALFEVENGTLEEFEKVSPVEYRVTISSSQDQFRLIFHENYHQGWRLYPTMDAGYFTRFIFNSDIARETHVLDSSSKNTWIVERKNLDQGSGKLALTVYFYPQSLFAVYMMLLGVLLVGYVLYLIRQSKGNISTKTNL